jgi:two-component system, OmpR family, phosphate regulon sensor histidine kinase PhoR
LFEPDPLGPPSDANTLERMLGRTASLLQARGCGVLLWDEDKGQLCAMAPFSGLNDEQLRELDFPVAGASLAPVVQNDRHVLLHQFEDATADTERFRSLGIQNALGVPLALERRDEANDVVERQVMGVCCAFDKHYGRQFDQEDARLLAMMARQVSAVLVTSRLYWNAVEARRRLYATVESMAVGLIAISPSGMITQINSAARRALGIVDQGWIGRSYQEVVQNTELQEAIEKARKGDDAADISDFQPREVKLPVRVGGNVEERIFRVQSEPIVAEDSQALGWVVVLEDVTDIRQAEQLKTSFVAAASHELRTPLTSIRGFVATLLQAGEGGFDWETQAEFLEIVDTEAERLGQLLDDLLNTARIESGMAIQFNFTALDLNLLITRVVKLQSSYVRGHTIDVKVEQLPTVMADEGKVLQVLNNLLSNAIKYSPNGGVITVEAVEENGGVRISVTDQGMGIPKEALANMFQRFYRVEGSHMVGIKGTGLGLYLIKHLIEGHEGKIWVDSEFGHGSTFSFWLPKEPSPQGQPMGENGTGAVK